MQPPEHAPGAKPLVDAERLGDAQFRKDYNVRLAYVAGAMVKGIASPELVIRMGRAELLSFLGAGGLGLERIEDGIRRIQAALPTGTPWGMNLLHNVNHPELEERTVAPSLDTYLNVVRQDGGSVESVDVWGRRRLAYEIKKRSEGIYAVIELNAEPATVKELDRQLNLNEAVLRTKLIRPDAH